MPKAKIVKQHIMNIYNKLLKDISQKRIFWGVVFCAIFMVIVGMSTMPDQHHVQVGQPSPMDFDAPRNINFISQVQTSIKKQEAADNVEPIYRNDESVIQELQENIDSYFSIIKNVRNYEVAEDIEDIYVGKVEKLKDQLELGLEDEIYNHLLTISEVQLERTHDDIIQIVDQYMQRVSPEDVEITKQNILDAINLLNVDNSSRIFLSVLIENIEFRANWIYDPILTNELREVAMENVDPVEIHWARNQRIVGQGVILTEEHIEALEASGFLTRGNPAIPLFGIALLVLIGFGLVAMYLYQYRPNILQKESLLILLGLLVVSTLLISNTVTAINIGMGAEYSALIAYAVPVAAVAMLIAILFDGKFSMFITTIIAIIIGVMNNLELQFALVAFAGGLAGIYSVSQLSQRSDLMKASIYVIGANVTTILSLGLILNYSLSMLSVALMLGIINGILSSVLTIGTLPFLEAVFRVTTSVKLLELSNPNQPLLRRLLLEAPGTYHHSVVVGNMAESAADAVGADALLARTGANYHDIGKVKRPYFFIENQFANENPHDKLAPTLSTLIITSHIKDGIELAKEHGLPDNIIDIISQHHGNSVVSFFYHKASEGSLGDVHQENDFRYDSPKPRTKEAAIVMLADTIEAGVRSIQKPTPNKIETFARKIIKEKLEDGQLEECELTFKELDTITQSFVKILTGIFHSRIEYPEAEDVLQEMEGGEADGDVSEQSTG